MQYLTRIISVLIQLAVKKINVNLSIYKSYVYIILYGWKYYNRAADVDILIISTNIDRFSII